MDETPAIVNMDLLLSCAKRSLYLTQLFHSKAFEKQMFTCTDVLSDHLEILTLEEALPPQIQNPEVVDCKKTNTSNCECNFV